MTAVVTESAGEDVDCRAQMGTHVLNADSPMLLLALPSGQTLELSEPMERLLGRTRDEALQMTTPDLTDDPTATTASLRLLAEGSLDGYTRRVGVPTPDGSTAQLHVRVDACDNHGPDRLAVVSVVPATRAPGLPGVPGAASSPPETRDAAGAVIGTATAAGVIDRIVAGDALMLPEPRATLVDRHLVELVHPEDVGLVSELTAHSSARRVAVTGRTRVPDPLGGWQHARIALQPLAARSSVPSERPGLAFVLTPDMPAGGTATTGAVETFHATSERNQQHLRAVAAAAHQALVDSVMSHSHVARLSTRERDIVTRLVAGQRVPAIARALFLSQSTIRNHLTGAYRKLGVSSQVEVIELLRPVVAHLR